MSQPVTPEGKKTFTLPEPFIHRRQRTESVSERVRQTPKFEGTVKSFCRQRGHGFVTPLDGSEDLFLHISDIEGEFVPQEGDAVTYQILKVPPHCVKSQAVHCKIIHLKEGIEHHRWESPVPH